jgi:hypothetical protein
MNDQESSAQDTPEKTAPPPSVEKKVVRADQGGVAVGGNVSGSTITTGDQNIIGSQINQREEFVKNIYTTIEEHPELDEVDKEDLKSEVQEIQQEDAKGEQVDESFIARRLRVIQRMAPDILDVVLATIANPAAGFSMVTKKVAERMKAGTADS